MEISDCKGCRSRQFKDNKVRTYSYEQKLKAVANLPICPCATCIVKVMCNAACREYSTYMTKIDKDMHFLDCL
jgi:hypothetical protein